MSAYSNDKTEIMKNPNMWSTLMEAYAQPYDANESVENVFYRFNDWKRVSPKFIDLESEFVLVPKRLTIDLLALKLATLSMHLQSIIKDLVTQESHQEDDD